jgi:exoribonuclease R
MEYALQINSRDYDNWSIINNNGDTEHFDWFCPIQQKMFHNDKFVIKDDNKIALSYSHIRQYTNIPGVLVLENNKTYGPFKDKLLYRCIPHDKTLPIFLIPYKITNVGFQKIFKNKYVLFSYCEWIDKHPIGKLTNTIGDVDVNEYIYEYQIHCYSLSDSLSNFNKQAKEILRTQPSINNLANECIHDPNFSIQDRRKDYIFAIDPEGSTDFDDAFSIECMSDGNKRVSVYIANVALWLEHLKLWKSMTQRVSTIYLPDKRRLLLPSILSDDICSLKQKQDNVSMYVDFIVDSSGNIITDKTKCGNASVNIKKNFVYEEERLFKNDHYKQLLATTSLLDNTITESHALVSYWMIQTNIFFAGLLKKKNVGIFRASSIDSDLNAIPKTNLTNYEYNTLKSFKTTHCEYVNVTKKLSHFVMGLGIYTHITSPIRRLVDIYNQLCFQYYYGLIDTLSDDAASFLEFFTPRVAAINSQTKNIKKVQNSCNLINMVSSKPDILNTNYEAIVFDKKMTNIGYEYNVFIPGMNTFSRTKTEMDFENYSKVTIRLFYFSSENQMNNKVKIQLL